MRSLIFLLFALHSFGSFAVDFTKLSRTVPSTTSYVATLKCYVDVSLFLNAKQATQGSVYLKVTYIVGSDTLNDHLKLDNSYNGTIKQFFLDEGERLTVMIALNDATREELEGIQGSLNVVRNPEFKPVENEGKNTFLSGVWKSDQTPLFRVPVQTSEPKLFQLKVSVNEQFEFDRLFLKMKVISPASGIVMLEKTVTLNDGANLEMRKKSFLVDIDEVDLSTAGTYYFQVIQNMSSSRINGVDRIEYQIVPQ